MEKKIIFLILAGFFFTQITNAQSPISDLTCRQDVNAGAV